jgi:hypothetical protein
MRDSGIFGLGDPLDSKPNGSQPPGAGRWEGSCLLRCALALATPFINNYVNDD